MLRDANRARPHLGGRIAAAVGTVALALIGLVAAAPSASADVPPGWGVAPGSPFDTAQFPEAVAISPDGELLATANPNSGDASVFSVGANGTLTEVSGSPADTGASPQAIAIGPAWPDGSHLIATANEGNDNVSMFAVPAGRTAVTEVSGSPFATGASPASLAFSPDGKLLAVANAVDNTVSVFTVAADGTLTEVTGSPFAAGETPSSLAFSPDGTLLTVANSGVNDNAASSANTVSVFQVGVGDALTEVPGSPFATGNDPESLSFGPSGNLLAVANSGDNSITMFTVGDDGTLTAAEPASPAGSGLTQLAFLPSGALAARSETTTGPPSTALFLFDVSDGGTLTPAATTTPADLPPAEGDPGFGFTALATGRGPAGGLLLGLAGEGDGFSNVSVLTLADAPPTPAAPAPPAAQPSLSTAATSSAVAGEPISDVATLAGMADNAGGTVAFSLYGPSGAPRCTTAIYTSDPIPVSGDGDYGGPSTVSFTPTQPGTYYWIARYTGDAGNAAMSGGCGDTGETSVVAPVAAPPSSTAAIAVAPTVSAAPPAPPAAAPAAPELASTGAPIAPYLATGSALLAAGLLMVTAARRRARTGH